MTLQEEIQYYATIRSEIPELLARLVNTGKTDDAVKLLVQWETHTKINTDLWKEAKELLEETA